MMIEKTYNQYQHVNHILIVNCECLILTHSKVPRDDISVADYLLTQNGGMSGVPASVEILLEDTAGFSDT